MWLKDNNFAATLEDGASRFVSPDVLKERFPVWLQGIKRRSKTLWQSFTASQDADGVIDFDQCIYWLGAKKKNGYAPTGARRAALKALYGTLPVDHDLDHVCHVPSECSLAKKCPHRMCINPAHMMLATRTENNARSKANKVLTTHCRTGHEYTVENTYIRPNGAKQCKQCRKDRVREIEDGLREPRSYGTLTHCRNGHEWNAENSSFDAAGTRRCRPCNTAAVGRQEMGDLAA